MLEFDNKEDFESNVPDSQRGNYEEVDGQYKHKEFVKVINSMKHKADEKSALAQQVDELNSQFAAIQAEKDRIAAEAEQAKLDKLQEEGKIQEILEIERERMSTTIQAKDQDYNNLKSEFEKLQTSIVEGKKNELAMKIAGKFTTPERMQPVADLIKLHRMKVVDGNVSLTNSDGVAVENDVDKYVELLNEDSYLSPFSGAPRSGGGFANGGNNSGGGGAIDLNKPLSKMTAEEKRAFYDRKVKQK